MQNAAMDDEIVAFTERKLSVHCLENSLPFADVHQLVRLRIADRSARRSCRLDVEHRDVLIEQQRNAIERRTSALFHLRSQKMPVMQRLIRIGLELHLLHATHRLHRRRRMDVIQQRRRAGEIPRGPSAPRRRCRHRAF